MHPLILKTPRLELLLEDTEAVLKRIEELPDADRAEVSPAWIEQLRSNPPNAWTHGFTVREIVSGLVVGSCGYKGPPSEAGVVEIAYGIDPAWRGRGYAKEAAAALVQFAYQSGASMVLAHTLPESSPSTSVLKSSGFEYMGRVVDPEDGPVWQWKHCVGSPNNALQRTGSAGEHFDSKT